MPLDTLTPRDEIVLSNPSVGVIIENKLTPLAVMPLDTLTPRDEIVDKSPTRDGALVTDAENFEY